MILTFKSSIPTRDTMFFEELFEEELRLSESEKYEILAKGYPVWLLVDGKLIGETYGIMLKDLKEPMIKDCEDENPRTVYCYSTAILPEYQKKGLGSLLKAYWLGKIKAYGVSRVVAHATSESAAKLNATFGAHFGAFHTKWYGTERTAIFYWIDL